MNERHKAVKELEDILKTQIGSRVMVVTTGASATSGVVAGIDDDILTLTRTVSIFEEYTIVLPLAFIPLREVVTLLNETERVFSQEYRANTNTKGE
ncbi:hypothetical protein [Halobacillus sp. K22]|uniref:hypothetical protein n=1 Tax=Halobacillus sp. K22 TaxID=3457431 RepID=UPI003FCDCA2F